MAKETTTVQCYPDDGIINKKIKEYESFGWELINNQRCQEYEGQTRDYWKDGQPLVEHYSTFNKLTFTRDKSAAWYGSVTELERNYKSKQGEINRINSLKPNEPQFSKTTLGVFLSSLSFLLIAGGAAALLLTFMIGWMDAVSPLAIALLVVGVLIIILRKVYKISSLRKYEAGCDNWRKEHQSSIDKLNKECDSIKAEAEKLINAN